MCKYHYCLPIRKPRRINLPISWAMMNSFNDDGGVVCLVRGFSTFLADGPCAAAAIGKDVRQDMEQKNKSGNECRVRWPGVVQLKCLAN